MQYFRMRDEESKTWHNYLIVQLPQTDFSSLKTRFETQVPKLTCHPIARNGHPYVVFEYGGAVDLSEEFGSGETLGDKLQVGDIVTVILTNQSQSQLFSQSEGEVQLNFNLRDVVAYPFTYTKEMETLYEFYLAYSSLKNCDRQLRKKSKKSLFG